jgi:hypothetical protein
MSKGGAIPLDSGFAGGQGEGASKHEACEVSAVFLLLAWRKVGLSAEEIEVHAVEVRLFRDFADD